MSGTLLSLAREDIPTIVFLRRQKLMSFLKAKKSNKSYGENGTGHAVTGGWPTCIKADLVSSPTSSNTNEGGLGMKPIILATSAIFDCNLSAFVQQTWLNYKALTYMKEGHKNGQSQ